jgi:transcription termination factor Rho
VIRSRAELERKHLADLHELAAELEIPDYRLLRRRDLAEQILRRQEQELAEEGEGVLAIAPPGHGFLRPEGEEDDDIYISAAQIRRCELEEGDTVSGPVRPPRRGERHRALIRVELVNGEPPPEEPVPAEPAEEEETEEED